MGGHGAHGRVVRSRGDLTLAPLSILTLPLTCTLTPTLLPTPDPNPHEGCSTTATSSPRPSVARSVPHCSSSLRCYTRRARTGIAGDSTLGRLTLGRLTLSSGRLTLGRLALALTLPPTLTRFEAVPGTTNHNVNVAQGLKSAAVLARFNASATHANRSMASLSLRRMRKLDAAYGLPTGMYVGDEITPLPYTRSPSRGVELCGVVEAMYSYEVRAKAVALARPTRSHPPTHLHPPPPRLVSADHVCDARRAGLR